MDPRRHAMPAVAFRYRATDFESDSVMLRNCTARYQVVLTDVSVVKAAYV